MKLSLLALIPVLVAATPIARDDADEQRLAVFGPDEEPVWLSASALREEKAKGRNYFDVTASEGKAKNWRKGGKAAAAKKGEKAQFPTPGHYVKKVDELAKNLDQAHMEAFLRKFTEFFTRYYKSPSGAAAQKFLLEEVKKVAANVPNGRTAPTVEEFVHPWGQNSIIAKFPGDASRARVILGAHLDSVAGRDGNTRSPGADDNGSGTTSLLEAFKVLVESGWKFKAPLEFHWYAGEEAGLLGSQAIANSYEDAGVEVRGYMNLDMTAWVSNPADEHVAIVRDFINPNLGDFLYDAVGKYLDIPAKDTACGYACSDHGSWNRSGYPSVFPFESEWGTTSPVIHTPNDTIDHPEFSWSHAKEFSKLALAFALELADK